jgi:archaellum biogenesis ATPase FlaH
VSLQAHFKNGLRGLRSAEKARKLVRRLETFRKLRSLFNIGANLENALSEDELDPDAIIQKLATSVTNAASSERQMRVTSRGDGNTDLAIAKKILNSSGAQFIPTGIAPFDSVNSGIPRGAFMLIKTVTGGGKSLFVSQMAENFAMQGAHVGIVPLEMSTEEMITRDIARASGVDMTDLLAPKRKMSMKARKKAFKLYRDKTIAIDKRGGSVKTIEPGADVDIQTLLSECKPFDFDVIIIDYVGLLKGAEGDQQWKELGNITRYCKIWAGLNNCVVIMAAQLSAEGLLRYSRTMEEHAGYAWSWIPDELTEQLGIIEIDQTKARQAKQFKFLVKIDYATMSVRACTREEIANYEDMREELRNKGKKQRKENDKRKGNGGPDDDDEYDYKKDEDYDRKTGKKSKYSKEPNHGKGKWSPTYKGGGGKSNGKKPLRNRFEEEF